MSSFAQGSQQIPNSSLPNTIDYHRVVETGAVSLYGSFQGFTSTAYLPALSRGAYYTVTWISTGRYRVKLYNFVYGALGVQPNGVADGSQYPGNPPGLLVEARCGVLSETVGTANSTVTSVRASKLDRVTPGSATYNSFDIFTYNATPALNDVPTTERIQFELVFKMTTFNP